MPNLLFNETSKVLTFAYRLIFKLMLSLSINLYWTFSLLLPCRISSIFLWLLSFLLTKWVFFFSHSFEVELVQVCCFLELLFIRLWFFCVPFFYSWVVWALNIVCYGRNERSGGVFVIYRSHTLKNYSFDNERKLIALFFC